MKVLLFLSMLFATSLAYANPGVTKGTDIGKRKATKHSQVTRCEETGCSTSSVTTFDKKSDGKQVYFGECNYSEEGGKRYEQCKLSKEKKKPTVKTVTKTVDRTKKNRLQFHLGYGTNGLSTSSDDNSTEIKENRQVIVGGQYTRALKDDLNVGFSVFSNKSATVTFGFDY